MRISVVLRRQFLDRRWSLSDLVCCRSVERMLLRALDAPDLRPLEPLRQRQTRFRRCRRIEVGDLPSLARYRSEVVFDLRRDVQVGRTVPMDLHQRVGRIRTNVILVRLVSDGLVQGDRHGGGRRRGGDRRGGEEEARNEVWPNWSWRTEDECDGGSRSDGVHRSMKVDGLRLDRQQHSRTRREDGRSGA
jgi:hypothetical protein